MGVLLKTLDALMEANKSPRDRACLITAVLENGNNACGVFDGYMVVTGDQRIGLATYRPDLGPDSYYVQHGAAGPTYYWETSHLQFANRKQLAEKLLEGVGCKRPPY